MNDTLLTTSLQLAIPLRILELQERGGITEEDLNRIRDYQDAFGSHGDDLFFQSKKKGQSAERFNQVADCIAVMSFLPGGITVFGQHWETH